jgi:hypothetical protein
MAPCRSSKAIAVLIRQGLYFAVWHLYQNCDLLKMLFIKKRALKGIIPGWMRGFLAEIYFLVDTKLKIIENLVLPPSEL